MGEFVIHNGLKLDASLASSSGEPLLARTVSTGLITEEGTISVDDSLFWKTSGTTTLTDDVTISGGNNSINFLNTDISITPTLLFGIQHLNTGLQIEYPLTRLYAGNAIPSNAPNRLEVETNNGIRIITSGSGNNKLTVQVGSDATGDMYQRNSSGNFSRLAAVATGNVLISGGVGTVNSWGKVGLTTHVSGTLPTSNGGTGLTAIGSASQFLKVNAGGTGLEYGTFGNNTQVIYNSSGVLQGSASFTFDGSTVNAKSVALTGFDNSIILDVMDDSSQSILTIAESAGSPRIQINLGSDATGDTYYRDSSGNIVRRAIGTEDQVLTVDSSGVPVWSDPTGSATLLIEDVSTTTYEFVEADNGKIKRFTNASGCTATVPTGLSTGWNVVIYRADGAGVLTVSSNGTLESANDENTIEGEKLSAWILNRGSDIHVLTGAIGPAAGSGSGSVTSVGLSVPTGFAVTGSPVTSSGTLALSFDTGYQGYTTIEASKLSGIETSADVTDAANVAAAGAIMDGDFSSNGIMIRTASGSYTSRTITAGTGISVSNGTGVSGNPTISLDNITLNTQSGTTYTLQSSDQYKLVVFTNASGCSVTIPVSLPTGWSTTLYRSEGAGDVVISSDGTLQAVDNTITSEKTSAVIIHAGSNVHYAVGALGTIGGSGTNTWGDITGTLSDQTDLQSALDAKQDVLTGLTSSVSELNILDGVTATASELNALDGITSTVTELNYTDGVTSPIQGQLDSKAPLASPTFTGSIVTPQVTVSGGSRLISFNGGNGQINMDGNSTLILRSNWSTSAASTGVYRFQALGDYRPTSGTLAVIGLEVPFSPTSGTAVFNPVQVTGTINQTGGANGQITLFNVSPTYTSAVDVTGFDYNPTVTSVSGNHIAWRNTSGKLIFGGITEDSTKTQILVKDSSTNQVFYRTVDSFIESGTYTPTLTAVNNVDGTTASVCQYMRVGDVVTFSGRIAVDPTNDASSTTVGVSLPVASNFSDSIQCGGTAVSTGGTTHGHFYSNATDNRADFSFSSTGTTNDVFYFTATYLVI